jgi:hypothetical protein
MHHHHQQQQQQQQLLLLLLALPFFKLQHLVATVGPKQTTVTVQVEMSNHLLPHFPSARVNAWLKQMLANMVSIGMEELFKDSNVGFQLQLPYLSTATKELFIISHVFPQQTKLQQLDLEIKILIHV